MFPQRSSVRAAVMFVATGVAIASCGKPGSARPPSTPPADPAPATPTPPPPEPLHAGVSIANFTKETLLDECVDFAITMPIDYDGGQESVTKVAEGLAQTMKKRGMSRLAKTCSDQFRTTPVVASCSAHKQMKSDGGKPADVDIISRYYDVGTLTKSDGYMKDCIDIQGDWQGLDKTSDEYKAAVHAKTMRQVEKLEKTTQ
jgi:hypothetical protein